MLERHLSVGDEPLYAAAGEDTGSVGEKTDAFENFHPDRVASRILGMGDMLSLIDKVQETIDQETAEKMQEKLLGDDFSLEDFRDQIKQVRKLGSLAGLLKMMPQIGPLKDLKESDIDEKRIDKVVAIIDSNCDPDNIEAEFGILVRISGSCRTCVNVLMAALMPVMTASLLLMDNSVLGQRRTPRNASELS